mgnify:FL=1
MATPVPLASKGTSKDPRGKALGETLAGLQSRELIVGFSGPLGSGVGDVIEVVDAYLRECGYDVVRIKLSGLISEYATLADPAETPAAVNQLKGADRYDRLQTLGNKLRSAKGLDFLAQLAIRQVEAIDHHFVEA